jgi:hypothetical protein
VAIDDRVPLCGTLAGERSFVKRARGHEVAAQDGSIVVPLLELDVAAIARLAERGGAYVHAVYAGAAHDWLYGAGTRDAVVVKIGEARSAGLPIVASTPLHRAAYRVLDDVGAELADRGVAGWTIDVLAGGTSAEVPRLAIAMPHALRAIARARERGVAAFVRGAPLCLLGPFADRAIRAPARAYVAACEACAARPSCPGALAAYLERYGARELAPREAPQRRDPRDGALASALEEALAS